MSNINDDNAESYQDGRRRINKLQGTRTDAPGHRDDLAKVSIGLVGTVVAQDTITL